MRQSLGATAAALTQRYSLSRSYGKNKDLAVPFWSTKDAGQQPFSFQIGQGGVIKAWDEARYACLSLQRLVADAAGRA